MSISLDEILLAKKLWWKSGGGSDISVQPLSVTENGTYTAESGQAYSPVAVNVPQTEVEPLTVNANGTYTPESGTAYGPVTVNVPSGSGGGGSTNDDVIFYDYDGSVVASYTASEFATVNALPANPSHDGLTAQGWNWSLEDAKTYVDKYGKLNIGQTYITDDGKTRIYIHLEKGRLAPYLGIAINGTATVEWGDGNTDTVTGTSTLTIVNTQHIYAAPGDYVIKIAVDGKMAIAGTSSSSKGDSNIGSKLLWANSNTMAQNRHYQSSVKKIEIGSNVNINDNAFYYCFSLTSITIPTEISSIGFCAFQQCYSLVFIVIPHGITKMGDNNRTYDSIFRQCYNLASISIPNSVTTIGIETFSYCYNLTSIIIPSSVTSIGNQCFYLCVGLTSILIPGSVTSIDSELFTLCYNLRSVRLSEGIQVFSTGLFTSCYNLTSVAIPDSATKIGNTMFRSCYRLSSVVIPDSVVTIGTSAFAGCYSFASITIPDSVTTIETYAFNNCYSLTSITIPDSVTTIGANAFNGCRGLGEIHFEAATPPTVGATNAWTYVPNDCVIYVPAGSLDVYKNATNYPNSTTYQYVEY